MFLDAIDLQQGSLRYLFIQAWGRVMERPARVLRDLRDLQHRRQRRQELVSVTSVADLADALRDLRRAAGSPTDWEITVRAANALTPGVIHRVMSGAPPNDLLLAAFLEVLDVKPYGQRMWVVARSQAYYGRRRIA